MKLIESIIAFIFNVLIKNVCSFFVRISYPEYVESNKFHYDINPHFSIQGRTDLFAESVPLPENLHIFYLGTNSLYISDGKTGLLIDPFFTRPDVDWKKIALFKNIQIAPDPLVISKILQGAHISKVDAVLTTHSHYDHALDVAEVMKYFIANSENSPMLYGSKSTYFIGKGGGVNDENITIVNESETYRIGDFEVQFILSKHLHIPIVGETISGQIDKPLVPPVNFYDYKDGETYGIFIKHKMGTILNLGSANYKENAFKFLKDKVDVLIFGIAGFEKSVIASFDHPAYRDDFYNEVVLATKPKKIYFSHYDDFNQPLNKISDCIGKPLKTYNYFTSRNDQLKPFFLPVGKYVKI
ncbi:MAG: MBL fold metallo-hydrolase [Bacteroidales bacterium]|nr:MBL fold metallo-hydrolase [Bacteroidales bacterium]